MTGTTVAWLTALALLPGGLAASDVRGAARLDAEQAQALVQEVSAEVEKLRRLRFKTPVEVKIVDGATARSHFAEGLDDEVRLDARYIRDAWAHLGLVPPSTDLVEARLDTAEEETLGYYEPGSKTFHLLSHVSLKEVRSVMAHELTHALEDQHYDLLALQRGAINEDHLVAIRAVIEGSAMVTTLSMHRREGGIARARQAAAAVGETRAKHVEGVPTFVQRRLLLPYTLGFSFLLRGKPWEFLFDGVRIEDIERAYTEPPRSTREILHPEQYWGNRGEQKPPLQLPDLSSVLGPGWSKVASGTIGELGLSILTGSRLKLQGIDALLPTRWTTEGADGTAGDVYHHYTNGDRKVTLLLTKWEALRDAEQFRRHLRGGNKIVYDLGVNVIIMVGDISDRGDDLAIQAAQGLTYWQEE